MVHSAQVLESVRDRGCHVFTAYLLKPEHSKLSKPHQVIKPLVLLLPPGGQSHPGWRHSDVLCSPWSPREHPRAVDQKRWAGDPRAEQPGPASEDSAGWGWLVVGG